MSETEFHSLYEQVRSVARDGIAGRGVLLDVPRARGVPWLEPGNT